MAKATVIGSTVLDINFELPKRFLHHYLQQDKIDLPFGEKLSAQSHQFMVGGSGANVAVGLAKLDQEVKFITALAEDGIGQYLTDQLRQNNLELEAIKAKGQSPISVILRVQGERTIVSGHLRDEGLSGLKLAKTGHLHLGPLHNQTEVIYQQLAKNEQDNLKISLNPSIETIQELPAGFKAVLAKAEVIFLNQKEAASLTHRSPHSSALELMERVLDLGVKIVCLTYAEKGAYVSNGQDFLFAPALMDKFNRLDSTGAGDAFTSGFLAGFWLSEADLALEQGLRFGIVNSGSVVSQIGGQAGLLDETKLRLESQFVKISKAK